MLTAKAKILIVIMIPFVMAATFANVPSNAQNSSKRVTNSSSKSAVYSEHSTLGTNSDSVHAESSAVAIAPAPTSASSNHLEHSSENFWNTAGTLALVAVGIVQAGIFVWQLILLRQSVIDTGKAATAATQAANEARDANEINRKMLLVEQRPWVTFQVSLPAPLVHGNDGWEIRLAYEIRNIGKTPAIGASFRAQMLPHVLDHWLPSQMKDGMPTGTPVRGTNVAEELKRFSSEGHGVFGHVLFPGEVHIGTHQINRNDRPFDAGLNSPGYAGQFILLVSVSYKCAIDESWRETARAFVLYKLGSKIALADGHFSAGLGELAIEQLGDVNANYSYAT